MTKASGRKLDFIESLDLQELESLVSKLKLNRYGTEKERAEHEIRAIYLSKSLSQSGNARVDKVRESLKIILGAARSTPNSNM